VAHFYCSRCRALRDNWWRFVTLFK